MQLIILPTPCYCWPVQVTNEKYYRSNCEMSTAWHQYHTTECWRWRGHQTGTGQDEVDPYWPDPLRRRSSSSWPSAQSCDSRGPTLTLATQTYITFTAKPLLRLNEWVKILRPAQHRIDHWETLFSRTEETKPTQHKGWLVRAQRHF